MTPQTLKAILALSPETVAGLVRRKTTRAVNTSKSTSVGIRTEGRTWAVMAYGEAWGVISSTYRGPASHCLLSSYTVHPSATGLEDFKIYASNGGTPRRALTRARNIIRLIVQTMRGDNTPEIQAALPITCPLVAEAPVELEEAHVAAPEPDWSPSSEEAHDAIHGIRHPTPETLPGLEPSTLICTPAEAKRLREYAEQDHHAASLGYSVACMPHFTGTLPPSREEWAAITDAPYPGRFTCKAGGDVWTPESGPYAPVLTERQPDYPRPMSTPVTPPRPASLDPVEPGGVLTVELPLGLPPIAPELHREAAERLAHLLGAPERADLIAGFVGELEGSESFMIDTDRVGRALVIGAAWAALEASRQVNAAPPKPHLKSGRAPYGFKRTDTGLVHCEEEREAAEEIARGRVNGESWGEITIRLNASRVPGARSGEWTRGKVRSAARARRAWLDAAEATRP